MAESNSQERELIEKLSMAYEVVEHRLTALWSAIDAVDTKTNIILGFASAVLVFLAGFYSWGDKEWPLPSLVLFCLTLAAYLTVVILSTLSYRIKEWSYRPDPSTLISHCQDENCSVPDMKRWIADECKLAIDNNLINLTKKARLTNWALKIFAVETILLAAGLIYAMF